MISVQNKVGRLIEVQFDGQVAIPDVTSFRSQLAGLLVKHSKVVIWVDLRTAEPFTPEVKAVLLGIMRSDNPRVDRAAYLTNPDRAINDMVDEMLGALHHDVRRQFTQPDALGAWLRGVLSDHEQAQLGTSLGRTPAQERRPTTR